MVVGAASAGVGNLGAARASARLSRTASGRSRSRDEDQSIAGIVKQMKMMNHAIQRFRNETNREVQALGSHMKRLEAELPERDQYQFHGISAGHASDSDLFKATLSSKGSGESKGSMNFGPGQMGVNESATALAYAQMNQMLLHVRGQGGGSVDEAYEPPPSSGPKMPANHYSTIIKGGDMRKKKGRMLFWSQDDHAMCWGLIPIWETGNYKYVLEITTMIMVVVSVIVIIVQSYDEFDPDRCQARNYPNDISNTELLELMQNMDATTVAPGSGMEKEKCEVKAEKELFYLQSFLILWFSIEYVIRWTAVRPAWTVRRPFTATQFWRAKLAYTFSFMALIDFCSIMPFFISLRETLDGMNSDTESGSGSKGGVLLILRVVRIMRIFKLTRHDRTLTDVFDALHMIMHDLFVFFTIIMTLVVLIATIMYYVEKGNPEGWFTSIPECMYWTIITFTSVGYGDRHPVSDGGRAVAAVASLVGTIMMNFPIALIILSFDEVYKIRKGREERAGTIVDRLFTWSDRHKGRKELVHGPTSITNKDLPQKSRSFTRFIGRKKSSTTLPHVRLKKNQKAAKKRLLDMILHPQQQHMRVGNGIYNGRDHYLASKYSTKWNKATARGRERQNKAWYEREMKKQRPVTVEPSVHAMPPPPAKNSLKMHASQKHPSGAFKKKGARGRKSVTKVMSKSKIAPYPSTSSTHA